MKIELKFVGAISLVFLIVGFYIGKYYEYSKIPDVVEYACNDRKTLGVQYYKDKIHIGLSDGREYTLPKVATTSYSNSRVSFYIAGKTTYFEETDIATYKNCLEP